MLITGGLNDPRVTYWEPAKWTARLRAMRTDHNLQLLKINMGAGHGGRSGRWTAARGSGEAYTFVLTRWAPRRPPVRLTFSPRCWQAAPARRGDKRPVRVGRRHRTAELDADFHFLPARAAWVFVRSLGRPTASSRGGRSGRSRRPASARAARPL
jgi:hypothetical protein